MKTNKTQKQTLRRRIEMEMLDTSKEIDYSVNKYDVAENWANYQDYMEAQRKKDYEKALVATYETGEIDPDSFDLLLW